MLSGKIDVCIVSKRGPLQAQIENIKRCVDVSRIIVETSAPLGVARMKAIQSVATGWFIFIDDDVFLTDEWFGEVARYLADDVGAVDTDTFIIGLGSKWDSALNSRKRPVSELKMGTQGWQHCTILRLEAVRDWKPSFPELPVAEDYDILEHVLKKNYRWLRVPGTAYHYWSWGKIWRNAVWASRSFRRAYGGRRCIGKMPRLLGGVVKVMLTSHPRIAAYTFLQNLASIWGLMF